MKQVGLLVAEGDKVRYWEGAGLQELVLNRGDVPVVVFVCRLVGLLYDLHV